MVRRPRPTGRRWGVIWIQGSGLRFGVRVFGEGWGEGICECRESTIFIMRWQLLRLVLILESSLNTSPRRSTGFVALSADFRSRVRRTACLWSMTTVTIQQRSRLRWPRRALQAVESLRYFSRIATLGLET